MGLPPSSPPRLASTSRAKVGWTRSKRRGDETRHGRVPVPIPPLRHSKPPPPLAAVAPSVASLSLPLLLPSSFYPFSYFSFLPLPFLLLLSTPCFCSFCSFFLPRASVLSFYPLLPFLPLPLRFPFPFPMEAEDDGVGFGNGFGLGW